MAKAKTKPPKLSVAAESEDEKLRWRMAAKLDDRELSQFVRRTLNQATDKALAGLSRAELETLRKRVERE